jgi:alanyl-tRNA synthetase
VPVRAFETSLETAREQGVTALFGEKYGEFVRVLDIDGFSKELCGGTHVGRTAEIGLFKIVGESSVGANMRRIEAVTSNDAYRFLSERDRVLTEAAAHLKSAPLEVADRVRGLGIKLRETEAALKQEKSAHASDDGVALDDMTHEIDGYRVVIEATDALTASELKGHWDFVKTHGRDALVVFGHDRESGKAIYLAAGNDAAVSRGFDGSAVVGTIAGLLGGRGGGKPTMAQGGSDDASALDTVSATVCDALGVAV